MEQNGVIGLNAEQAAKLRESFERCSPETIEAVLHFRTNRDLASALTSVHGIIERYARPRSSESTAQMPDTTRLREDLDIDSLTMLEIVMSIEEALDFQLEPTDARHIHTLGDLRQYVDDRIHHRPVSLSSVEVYERDRLWAILPQQPSHLFLDRAEIRGEVVRASYLFRGDEVFFSSHSPNDLVVPTSIIHEALGQACCLWLLEYAPARLQQPLLANQVSSASMDEAQFLHQAKSGDEIQISLKLTSLLTPLAVFQAEVKIQDQLLATIGSFTMSLDGPTSPTSSNGASVKF